MKITDVSTSAEAVALESAATAYQQTLVEQAEHYRCAPTMPMLPPHGHLTRLIGRDHLVLRAAWTDAGEPLLWAVVRKDDGRIEWLLACRPWTDLARPDDWSCPYAMLCLSLAQSCGHRIWGELHNDALHELFTSVHPYIVRNGRRSEWNPDLADEQPDPERMRRFNAELAAGSRPGAQAYHPASK